jgi:hypothetical protein
MWRLLIALPVWAAYLAIDGALAVVGAVAAVPLAIALRRPMRSPVNGNPIVNAPRWLWIWGNDEDGLDPIWYAVIHPTWGAWRRMYTWAAIRNSVNNLRFLPGFGVRWYAEKCHSVEAGRFQLTWQDVRYRLVVSLKNGWVALGWKYEAAAARGQRVGFGFRRKFH